MGKITTHILDTAAGCPAAGVRIILSRAGEILADCVTNDDGRCDNPVIEGNDMTPGRYRLEFQVGDYFRQAGVSLDEVPFLDIVPVEFGITDAGAAYHIPLLISPYGYSSYRGS